ncbi:MAG: HTTM domain-containing protein [Ginsengibacter sp.]
MSIINTTDRIIFKSFNLSNESLSIYRISYSLYLLITGIPTFVWINNFPSAFYNPPIISLASIFAKFPPYWFLMFISLGTCLFSILLLFGYKTRLVSLSLSLFILSGKFFNYSFGKIDHDWLLWLIPLIMAFSNWGKAYSIDSKKNNQGENNYDNSWHVTLLALILCLAMFSAGLQKMLGGWLNISTQAVRGHLLSSYYQDGRQSLLAPFFLKLNSSLIWEFFDYAAVFFEITFLFALIRPNLFRSYIFYAIIFHTLNLLMFNIPFSANCIAYLLFIDWNMVIDFFRKNKVLISLNKLVNVKNLVIVAICYFIFFFIVLKQNTQESSFTVSPLNYVLKIFNSNPASNHLIIGNTVIFLTLFLSIINVVYFIRNKKFKRNIGQHRL